MRVAEGAGYDPETITLLRSVLDAAWDALPPEASISKSDLAMQLLRIAAQGERDPHRLQARTMMSVVTLGA
jgi:hypothetical protein